MSLGTRIIDAIESRRNRLRTCQDGALGEFYRNGGNDLLYDLPVKTGGIVIDAGGFEGEWTKRMIAEYGCRSEIYEPFPTYAERLKHMFRKNSMVNVHSAALGGANRRTTFCFSADGTSEHLAASNSLGIEVPVTDISDSIDALENENIGCLKLNIEGGEYEVLERIISNNQVSCCASLLIQFHPQPDDWKPRLTAICEQLELTHTREWCYPLVWEKWVRKSTP